jgi:hypothetical protein
MSVNGSGRNEQSKQMIFHRCFLPSFGSFGQTVSEEKNLKIQPIRNKNRLWQPCLLTDRDGMSNLYIEPSIDTSYQISNHFFRMDRDEMSTLYRGPPIDVSYRVSVHLAKRFQRRRILKIRKSETRVACGNHVC